MLCRKLEITKDEQSAILQIPTSVRQLNWGSRRSIGSARAAIINTADKLCQIFKDASAAQKIPFPTYIRNLIAISPKNVLGAWTAFLHHAVSSKKTGFDDLEATAYFLSNNPSNRDLLFQLLDRNGGLSLESAALFFEDDPEKGLEVGFTILSANQNVKSEKLVSIVNNLHRVFKKYLAPKIILDVWIKLRLPRIDFRSFLKLNTALRSSILSNRFYISSILDESAIDDIRSNPAACHESPVYAYLHLDKRIANHNWIHSKLIPLITTFLTEELKHKIFEECRRDGYGYGDLDVKDIASIPDKRLRNAFSFVTTTAKKRLSIFYKLSPGEQSELIIDIPIKYWPETLAAIQNGARFKSTFECLNRSGDLEKFLEKYLISSHYAKEFKSVPTAVNVSRDAEYRLSQREKGDRIALIGAATFGFYNLIDRAIQLNSSRYRFISKQKDTPLIKAVISSVLSNEQLTNLISLYGEAFVKAWLLSAPVKAANRLASLVRNDDAVVPLSLKKDVLRAVMDVCPKRLKTFLQGHLDVELYRFVSEQISTIDASVIEGLINSKEPEGRRYVWERLIDQYSGKDLPPSFVRLLGNGKKPALKRAYELRPDIFFKQAINRFPLRQVLLTAFCHPRSGYYIEKRYPRSRLKKEIKWVREIFRDKPTISTAYETALALSLPDARFLLYLAAFKWKEGRKYVAGHVFDHLYRTYPLPKKSGGNRNITVPERNLKRLQRRILRNGLEDIAIHQSAHGFIKKRSIVTNASCHTGQELVINLDIAGFFPNTRYSNIARACKKLAGDKLSTGCYMLVADICSYQGGLPTGAPTSPYIGNIILHSIDKTIAKVPELASSRCQPARIDKSYVVQTL